MNTMKNVYILLLIEIILFPIYVVSQTITMSQVDASQFPRVATNFVATDQSGGSSSNIKPSDFEVYENGSLIPSSTYQVNCNKSPYKIILILDQSTSMNEVVDGVMRWQWVMEGAKNFINSLNLNNGSEIALETFGGESFWKCDFTSNKQEIIDSLYKVSPFGKTNFNVPFFGPKASAIDSLVIQPFGYQRIIVFLTDGVHNDQNDPIVKVDPILSSCRNNNIQFFAITFQANMNNELSYIAQNTNGDDYVVASVDGLTQIYKLIANKINNELLCSLTWESTLICDDIDRLKVAKIRYKPYSTAFDRTYIVPEYGVARIQSDQDTYLFKNPDIGSYYDVEMSLTPKNSNTSIQSMSITPSTYFSIIDYGFGEGVAPKYPINVVKDGIWKIKVRFTPASIKTFRKANLLISSLPCPTIIPLIGGIPEIFVDNPIKDEIFSVCDTVNINWSGVDSPTAVDLSFSSDDGSSWNTIKKNVKNNSYPWFPPAVGENLTVKAEISPLPTYIWAASGGGKYFDNASSIAITPDNYSIYVAGYFNDVAYASDQFIVSKGATDAFLAKYDTDGNLIWIKSDGGVLGDSSFSVATDAAGNAYYVGTCHSDATFGGLHSIMEIFSTPYLFVAKYSPDGEILGVYTFGANNNYSDFKVYGRSITIVGNTITIVGQYTGYMKMLPSNFTFTNTQTPRNFRITMSVNLLATSFALGGTITTKTSVMDKYNYKYEIHNFLNYNDYGRFTVKSQGYYDYSITKYGLGTNAFGISEPFNVYYPSYVFISPTLDVQKCLLGDTCISNFPAALQNNSKIPAKITGFRIIANPPLDQYFQVDSSIIGKTLLPDESTDIKVTFSTLLQGDNSVQLIVYGDCYEYAMTNLKGVGECKTEIVDSIDCGSVVVGDQIKIRVDSLIKNFNNIDIVIDPIIQGANGIDFTINKIANDTIGKKSSYDIEIIFRPISIGIRTARIVLRMNTPCGDHVIYLVGKGISYQPLPPEEIDWKVRRINKSYDTTIKIYNPTKVDYQISAIRFESPVTNNEFSFPQAMNLPIILQAFDTTFIQISFLPTDEIQYTNALLLTVGSKDGSNELRVDLKGHGFYPQYSYTWDCGTVITPYETTTASLTIKNTQNYSNLTIGRIFVTSQNNVYTWVSGSDPQGVVIPPQTEQIFDVNFTPISSDPSLGSVVILADDYDGNFPDFWKETRFTIHCTAIDLENPPSVDFGSSLLCLENNAQFPINNISSDSALVLYLSKAQISGTDQNDFKLLDNLDLIINSLDSAYIQLQFIPSHTGEHTATIIVPNSFNIPISIRLIGYGEEITLLGKEEKYSLLPGTEKDFSIIANIPSLNQDISHIKLNISYNGQVIQLKPDNPSTSLNDWNWVFTRHPDLNYDTYDGNGTIPTPFNGEIAKLKFQSMLNIDNTTDIKVAIDYGCQVREFNLSQIDILPVCMDSLILIELISNIPFIEPPVPNPTDGSFTLKFGVGEKSNLNISIFNIMGEKVLELINQNVDSGVYSYSVDITNLQSGMYFLVYSDNKNKFVEKLSIYK